MVKPRQIMQSIVIFILKYKFTIVCLNSAEYLGLFFTDIFVPPLLVYYYIILVHFFSIYPKFILDYMKDMEAKPNDDRRPKTFSEVLSRFEYANGDWVVYRGKSVEGRFSDGNVSIHSRTSRRRISGALLSCLQDSSTRRDAERLNSVESPLQQAQTEQTATKFQRKSLDALSDSELLARHLEENSEAVGEILRRTADIEINPRVLNLLVNKKLKEYGISKEGREQVASVVPSLMDSAKINAVKGGDITADLISGKAVEVHFGMLSITDEAIIFKA